MTQTPLTPAPAFHRLTPAELATRKRRNVWIALGLVAFMVLLFTTTFLRMMQNQKAAHEANAAIASAPQTPSMGAPSMGAPSMVAPSAVTTANATPAVAQ